MEIENTAKQRLEELQKEAQEAAEKRKKQLMKREVPTRRTLKNALSTMTRQELDDIRYNVGLSGTSGMNKAELIEKLVPSVKEFARTWFVSLLDEQYQAFRHLAAKKGGISTEFRADEARLDYFQSLGMMASGAHKGELAWYLPKEILEEFQQLDKNQAFQKAVELNNDVFRIAAGYLFYYGVMDYDRLFSKVRQQLEISTDDLSFSDFMKVMFNGSCWQRNVRTAEHVAYYYTVMDPGKILEAQDKIGVSFAKLSYGQVYDAGEEDYIEATDEYKGLAQFFMAAYKMDVLRAAEIVGHITILLQNGGEMKDVLSYIEKLGEPENEKDMETLSPLLIGFHQSLRMWKLKGHTPTEIVTGKLDPEGGEIISFEAARRKKAKVGRNDPCPCGSGKKYKNCCMRKDMGEE
ncbi:MAG: SEC-C domain-containing protein [Schwartzia sp.]|nr:SEC-C domain-containing protein [Schwartzia sp. (in: firmicutes)]